MTFQPSLYSDWGIPDDRAGDATKAALTTVSAGATGVTAASALVGGGGAAAGGAVAAGGAAAAAGGASAAGGLATAAAASATVPVVGWVVGGILAATAATVAAVAGIRKRKINKAKAVRWARKLGLPDPETVPGFVLRLSRKPKDWRLQKLQTYKRKLAAVKRRERKWKRRPGGRRVLQVVTLGIMRGPNRLKRQRARLESKIALIEALEASYVRRAKRRRQDKEEAERTKAIQAQGVEQARQQAIKEDQQDKQRLLLAVAGLGAVAVVVAVQIKKNQRTSKGKI